jgi:multicomponent Na+:H+ antiporter subunit C
LLYAVGGLALFALGLHGLIVGVHPLRRILALNILGSGVFLVLIAIAGRDPGAAPDPVPHAMVLTGLVVSVSTTALALTLLLRTSRRQRTTRSGAATGARVP